MYEFDNAALDALRESVRLRMNEKRYRHTLGVEAAAIMLGGLYMPKRVQSLRAAALLHDITKNETNEKQLQYLAEFDIIVGNSVKYSPKLYHSITASAVILRDYPEFASYDVVSAVRWHTTGRYGMRLFDALIYLADYIEENRTFEDCVRLREYFLAAEPERLDGAARLVHLYKTMVMSVDMTVRCLMEEGGMIDCDTIGCRNYYLERLRSED